MYYLTLTKEERKAFDWVGGRYAAGEIADLLVSCMGPDDEWTQEGDIAFSIPEHVAWDITELAHEEDYSWPCFAPALASKLNEFLGQIV